MRIKLARFGPKPGPDERRVRQKFAWFPRKTNDGYLIWLESYTVVEYYSEFREQWEEFVANTKSASRNNAYTSTSNASSDKKEK